MAWLNGDGLLVKFGTEEALMGGGGEYRWNGPFTEVEFDVQWNRLNAFGTVTILDETVRIPNGVLLTYAEFEPVVAFTSGGSATLSIGLHDLDRTTAYNATGIDATIALTAIDAVGETVVCDGALINTVLANDQPSLVSVTVGTANFTAGRGKLRLRYFVPTPAPKLTGALA
jgi:hypothetical protein